MQRGREKKGTSQDRVKQDNAGWVRDSDKGAG